jgi:hypothetical protein
MDDIFFYIIKKEKLFTSNKVYMQFSRLSGHVPAWVASIVNSLDWAIFILDFCWSVIAVSVWWQLGLSKGMDMENVTDRDKDIGMDTDE